VIELDEADPALRQAARQQAVRGDAAVVGLPLCGKAAGSILGIMDSTA
jgi:hypothetical protein